MHIQSWQIQFNSAIIACTVCLKAREANHFHVLKGFWYRGSPHHVISTSTEREILHSPVLFLDAPSATQASAIIKLELGEDRSIGCPVDIGNPPAVITWYKGNDTSGVKMSNCSTLEVKNVASSDEGWYTCFAKNELGIATVRFLLLVGKLNGYRLPRHQGDSPPANSPPRNDLATNVLATKWSLLATNHQ